MQNIYCIGDHHFGHENIIEYVDRPFDDIEEMDNYMINSWNKVIDKDDIVYHHGDMFFCNRDRQFEIAKQLNGHIIIIKGNHDSETHKRYMDLGFEAVFNNPVILEKDIILSHWPVKTNLFNVHGHIHNNIWEDEKHLNVSCEQINYKPLSLNEIKIRKYMHKFYKYDDETLRKLERDLMRALEIPRKYWGF